MERAQEHGIDHAEDCSVRANAERQREDGNQSKAGALPQHSRCVMQVLPESLGSGPSPHLTRDFFDKADIAEFPAHIRPGFLFRLTALDPVARGHCKVRSDLLFELHFLVSSPPEWEPHASSSSLPCFRMPAITHNAMRPVDLLSSPFAPEPNKPAAL